MKVVDAGEKDTEACDASREWDSLCRVEYLNLQVGRRDSFFGLIFLLYAARGCRFEPVQTERGYVHRSEDVCDRVQLSLHLLKAMVFCENCTKLHSLTCRTSAASGRRGLNLTDILLPSCVTTPTLLFLEPRVPDPSKGALQVVSAIFLDE